MGFLTELTEQMTGSLLVVADVWLVDWSKRLNEEMEKVGDNETQERLREYKEDVRAIALGIHELLSKLAFDEMVDPDVAERLRAFLSTKGRESGQQ